MAEPLLTPRFLFRFSTPCLRTDAAWSGAGLQLPEEYRLISFAEFDDLRTFADVRMGWSPSGIALNLRVQGKRQAPWCRETQMSDSDGLHVWIDTRDTHNIHRASRFCHRFAFLPSGGGSRREDAASGQLLINRSREHPRPAERGHLKVRAEKRVDGYLLEAFISANALTGYDPEEHARLGFTYAVLDREFGDQTFSVGAGFPYDEDPSLWATLELVK